jgi:hypothetical protein
MTATRNGNTITIAPLVDSLCGLKSGWAIRFTEFPQYLFHAERNQTADQAIALCASIAKSEGLKLRSTACTFQVFEEETDVLPNNGTARQW